MKKIAQTENLYDSIVSFAKKDPEKIALLSCAPDGIVTEEISYGRLAEKIEECAAYLLGLGLKKGDRVALAFGNSKELLILSWAAWSMGIVTVPLDVKHDTGELYRYKIKISGAKLLIGQDKIFNAVGRNGFPGIKTEVFSGFPHKSAGKIKWLDGFSHLALILFTSGTTGHPKGAKLSLKNLVVNANGIRDWLHIKEDDRFLVNLPLSHINSTTFCLATLLSGGSIAMPPVYSSSNFWRQAAGTRATLTSIVWSIVHDQLGRESEYAGVKKNLALNRIQIGSAPVIPQGVSEFRKKYHIPLYQGYGQTETSLRVTGVPMNLPEDIYAKMIDDNSIGVPMKWADLRISDDKGRFLNENEEGELVIKGDAVMSGYVGEEPAFRDGYFLTGDIGLFKIIEGQRFFFLKGRKKEIIIKGGVNISPSAVENSLKKISAADIDQGYVIGMADDRYGEEVAAIICWKAGIDIESAKRRLKFAFLSGSSHISAYETPKYIASISLESIPMTSTGKVQRAVLKKQFSRDRFEPICKLFKTDRFTFSILVPRSPLIEASHKLYNLCWEPLTIDKEQYEKNVSKQFILVAEESSGNIAGQIAFIRTDLESERLLQTAFSELLTPGVENMHGGSVVCISINNSNFRPKPVPSTAVVPEPEAVEKYLKEGNDPVYNFHRKPKADALMGAELLGVIKGGRPEDRSSCGYTMLLKYPRTSKSVGITEKAPVSNQLIEAVLILAKDLGINDVYAYSRPGGLALYIASKGDK